MKTETDCIGEVTIFGSRKFQVYFAPLKDRANHLLNKLTFQDRLCGRAITYLAAGFASFVWQDAIAGQGDWSEADYITVGSEKWRLRIVKHLPKAFKGSWAIASRTSEILVVRGNAQDMALCAMLATDYAWMYWQLRTLRASLNPMPEQLPTADVATWEADWEAVKAKLRAA